MNKQNSVAGIVPENESSISAYIILHSISKIITNQFLASIHEIKITINYCVLHPCKSIWL